jgi:chromosome partitioning protein
MHVAVALLMADTLLTPLQDSFLDLCPLGLTDPITHEVTQTGHYAAIVCEARMDDIFADRPTWSVGR